MAVAVVGAVESAVGREADVNAIIIIGRCFEEPAVDAVVRAERNRRERCAAHPHAVGNDAQGHVFLRHGIHHFVQSRQFVGVHSLVANLRVGIVGVFRVADGGQEKEREIVGGLHVEGRLHAVVLFAHSRHGEVSEGRLLVVVESALFHLASEARVVSAEFSHHGTEAEGVTEVRVVDVFIGEVIHKIILCAGCHESIARQRSLRTGAGTECDRMVERRRVGHAEFTAAAEEFSQSTLAEAVVLVASVLHSAVAFHACAVDMSRERDGPMGRRETIVAPRLSLGHIYIIIVAEAIAFGNLSIGVPHVVLRFVGSDAVVVHRKLVEVGVARGAEQVGHGFIVHAVRTIELYAERNAVVHVESVVERRAQRPHTLVVVSAFLIVERFPTLLFVAAVGKVELIPVDLSVRLVGRPVLAKCFPLFEQEILVRHVVFVRIAARAVASPHVAHARGEVLIIVRSRIVSITIPS